MSTILINTAVENLHNKIAVLDVTSLSISDYNRRYLKDYIDNFYFFMPLYKQLLHKAIGKLNKPIAESVFVDYGGGCGILSFLAVELGFKTIIYNDVYEVSTNDAKEIAEEIGSSITHFITGGIKEFSTYISKNDLPIDLFCSFDVLEHIYNLEDWFLEFKRIKGIFSLCFMTSANGTNPYVKRALKKIHFKAEHVGSEKIKGWKERDSNTSFLAIRKQIIKEFFTEFKDKEIDFLAKKTRGLYKPDIINKVEEYKERGFLNYNIKDKTNTCDPMTGNWAEHIIDTKDLKNKLQSNQYQVRFTNSYYSYSKNKLFNIPKYILNKISKLLGEENLFLSPSYTLEIDVKN